MVQMRSMLEWCNMNRGSRGLAWLEKMPALGESPPTVTCGVPWARWKVRPEEVDGRVRKKRERRVVCVCV